MTEKESKELQQKQENEILREINGEEEVEYGLLNDEFTGKIALHVLDLSCLEQVTEEERDSALYYWACVFKAKTWKEVLAMAEQSESIKKAVVTLRELSEDEKIRLQCEGRERYQMDWQSSMRTSREKGREEGRESGLRDGKLQNARKVTLALMEREMPLEEIAQIVEMDERIIREWIAEK
ncbi:hypothetical protein DXA98_02420 [Lachnospiraceae bacterium OF09-6]|nr:hypothetical protein DXA98_02420 [Lachnospiraceae bacterium OF09-6]